MRYILGFIIFLIPIVEINAQNLHPSFEVSEYLELMRISARTAGDSSYYNKLPAPENHTMIYQSPVMGLKNKWDLWIADNQKIAVISIRGTTADPVSWLENFYAGMVSANGKLHLSDDFQFEYQLAEDQKAAVHIGWLVGTAFLSRDILPKIDSLYEKGIKDFLIIGHSQGGGISYLLTSHLNYLQKQKKIPSDIRWKTYCSAAPKPGNLYYAYDFESMTQEGWAYNVVNASDWVPQVPFSIQTINDFNEVNPFKDAKKAIKKQKFPDRIVMRRVFNQLDKPTRKAQRNFQKYLGDKASIFIKKNLPEFQKPDFIASNHYVRTGNTIVLLPDDQYREKYPDNSETVFMHHFHQPYMELTERKLLPISTVDSYKPFPFEGYRFTGNEPFWGLEINENEIKFQSLVDGFEKFNAPRTTPAVSGNGKSITFISEPELGMIKIEITKESCMDSMSGIEKTLNCQVSIKRGIDTEFKVFKGCGDVTPD